MVDDISYSSEELGMEVSEDELMKEIKQDIEEDQIEDEELLREELEEKGFVPEQERDMGPVAFLERNINRIDKISVANLTPEELGKPTLSVRFWRHMAASFDGKTLYNMPLVHAHLLKKAQVNEATSLSKDAKALELVVTNKRVRERKSGTAVDNFLDHIRNKRGNQNG